MRKGREECRPASESSLGDGPRGELRRKKEADEKVLKVSSLRSRLPNGRGVRWYQGTEGGRGGKRSPTTRKRKKRVEEEEGGEGGEEGMMASGGGGAVSRC